MRRRSGFTLVEVMASISVSSVLLVLSMGMVHRVLNLESSSRDEIRVSRSITRLSHDFRHDVQRAVAVEVVQEAELMLTLADGSSVSYHVTEEYLLRERHVNDTVAQRETYDLPRDAAVRISEQESPSRLALSISRDLKLSGVAPRPLRHTVVEVGRLVRLSTPQEPAP